MRFFFRRSFLLFFALFPNLFFSCVQMGKKAFHANNELRFDTIAVSERYHLENDTISPFCDITVRFIYPLSGQGERSDSLIRFFISNMFGVSYENIAPADAVMAYLKHYNESYRFDAQTYRENVSDHPETEQPPGAFYSYHEHLSDTIVYNQNGLLSFQVKRSNYKEGAPAYDSYRNYVLDLRTCRRITENDIFQAGYDTALQNLFVLSLLEQNQVKTMYELEDLGFFGLDEMMPNNNFLLDEKGFTYIFNRGEYSAYPLDAPKVFIPYSAIRSLLKDNSIVAQVASKS